MRHLFICGVPRSGTTALATLLGSHEQVVLGIERFKLRYRGGEVSPELFAPDRFFAFEEGDTDVGVAKRQLDEPGLRSKYENAAFVGDKYPRLYMCFKQLFPVFPEVKVIYLLRNPVAVAQSWERRAADSGDRWPSKNDHTLSITEWNLANRLVLRAIRDKKEILVVNYDRLFDQKLADGEVDRILKYLNLERDESINTSLVSCLNRAKVLAKKRPEVSEEIATFVADSVDLATCGALCRRSRCGLKGMPEGIRRAPRSESLEGPSAEG